MAELRPANGVYQHLILPHASPEINHQGISGFEKKLKIIIHTQTPDTDETGRIILDKVPK